MTLGEFIKDYRSRSGDSMDTFSKKSGLSKAYISILERNYNPNSKNPPIPSLQTIKSVASVIGMDFNDIISALDGQQLVSLDDEEERALNAAGAFPINPIRRIPLIGQIAAGLPLFAEQNLEGYIWTDRNHGAEYFGLRVRGDSMDAANIKDGDIIIVRKQETVEKNDIAVILVDDNATIKRYQQQGEMVILTPQSTNPQNQTQIYSLKEHDIRILGKVVESRTEY